jgi:low temperature requirement protein LtrA
MILVGTGVLLFVAFNLFNKFKQSQIPTLYFLGILAIQSLPTAHYKTPVFIVPVLVGLVIGYCLGSIDSKVKDKIEELAD